MSPLEMMIKRFVYKFFLINLKVGWVENIHLFEERDRASTQPNLSHVIATAKAIRTDFVGAGSPSSLSPKDKL